MILLECSIDPLKTWINDLNLPLSITLTNDIYTEATLNFNNLEIRIVIKTSTASNLSFSFFILFYLIYCISLFID